MLFKILYGDKSRISTDITPYHEGYCYVTHDGYFYVDMNNERVKLSAKEAEKLTGYNISTILNSSDLEIPTSKAAKEYIDSAITNVNSIIDATELPTNDINENAIYRTEHTMTIDGAKIYFVDGFGGSPLDIEEFAKSEGASVYINVVDNAQTQSIPPSTNTEMYAYIDKETGIAYLNFDNMVLTAGQLFGSLYGMEVSDNGWSTDINSETNPGMYCVYAEINKIYHNYHIFKDSVWTNLTGSSIIDVNALPKSGVNENVIYRIPGVSNLILVHVYNGSVSSYLDLLNAVMAFGSDDGSGTPYDPFDTIEYILVDELPETGKVWEPGSVAYVYIVNSTGIGYLWIDDEWRGAGNLCFGQADCGWSDNPNTETTDGVYATYFSFIDTTYHIFDGIKWATLITEIDKTLTKEDRAADAKAVGDAINSITTTVNNKVDKVDGKDLSTNDFTDIYRRRVINLKDYSSGLSFEYVLHSDGSREGAVSIGSCTDEDIVVPYMSDVYYLPITYVSASAFEGSTTLHSIELPDSIRTISSGAFKNCSNLVSIYMGQSVETIYDNAFYGCLSLKSVILPDSLTDIGPYAFDSCSSLTSITIPDSVVHIGKYAFSGCSNLASIIIPDSVTEIAEHAFDNCNNLTIYCEAESQPGGWSAGWNSSNCPVIWGAAMDFPGVNNKLSNCATTEYVDNAVFSGDYNDLTNKPTIPTVPTKVSAFENDSNYITQTELETYINEAILGGAW